MSDLLQLGQHPDADQLNAFVEHCLPEHEQQQTLAHLATCSDCRAIVALSLPTVAEAPVADLEPASRPWWGGWFSGWKIAWVAAPALAALVFLTIHARNVAGNRSRMLAPVQVSDGRPHSQLQPPTAKEHQDQPAMKRAASSAGPGKAARHRPEQPSRLDEEAAVTSAAPESITQLPLNGRALSASEAPQGNASVGGPVAVRGALSGQGSGSGAGIGGGISRAETSSARESVRAQAQPSVDSNQAVAAAAPPPITLQQAKPSAAVLMTDQAFVNVTTENRNGAMAVTRVPRASGLVGQSAMPKGASAFAQTHTQAPLPSGLPLLSSAANLRQRVALDTNHVLFFSEDEGRHWKPVLVPWKARAITVAVVSSDAPSPPLSFAVPERFVAGALAATPVDALGSSLSGTVTDAAGAVIPGASVVVKESRYALVRTETTDAAGHYLFANLAPGSYRIDAQAAGFAKQSLLENLASEQQAVRDVILSVGQAAQTVTVDAASVQLETHSQPETTLITNAAMVEAQPPAAQRTPVFVVTTESGDRWTSADGRSWNHE